MPRLNNVGCYKYQKNDLSQIRPGIVSTGCPQLQKPKDGSAFSLERDGVKAGTKVAHANASSIENFNKRSGMGNYYIRRPGFETPAPKARNPIDFNKLQALDIEKFGQKVQISDKSIGEMFEIDVPDSKDTKWLAEKTRLTQFFRDRGLSQEQIDEELRVNKPLGREQRTVSKKKNIAKSNLSTAKKLDEIEEEIKNGQAQSVAERATLTGEIANVLASQNTIARLTRAEIARIATNLQELNVPSDYKIFFGNQRIYDAKDVDANKGLVAIFLMSNIPAGRTPDNPLMNWNDRRGIQRYEPAGIEKAFTMSSSRFLDLQDRTIDNAASLIAKGLAPPSGPTPPVAIPTPSPATLALIPP